MKRKRRLWRTIIIMVVIIMALVGWFLFVPGRPLSEPPLVRWGVTFTPSHARYLGLDWKQAYRDLLDDVGVRSLRLSVPWDETEPEQGAYRFDDTFWMLKEAQKRGVKVLMAVGLKTPRWPECRMPEWVRSQSGQQYRPHLDALIVETVKRLRSFENIEAWQVENEALFPFGQCPPITVEDARREVALVRSLDRRPIVATESGELSTWRKTAGLGDILGVSVYRRTWNPITGYFTYPLAPAFYARKARWVAPSVGKIIVTELQMEPWVSGSIVETPLETQQIAFALDDFRAHQEYVKRIGFDTIYLWGAEWWIWMKEKQRHPEFYEEAKKLFSRF